MHTSPPTLTPLEPRAGRDGFLDAIKAIALWRVVVWHALAWPWLSWFAAMPAMFYVAGVLLHQSLDRRGAVPTVAARLRRLLVPFWVYGLVAGAVMVVAGWRPRLLDVLWWVVPIGDPTGLDSTPGLWIPLWYLRAYLWILLAAGALTWACRRFGVRSLLLPVGAVILVWGVQSAGHEVPLALADAALFPFFVMAGMLTAAGRLRLSRGRTAAVAIGAAAVGAAWFHLDGAPMGIVNGSLPVHLSAGIATVAGLAVIREPLARPGPTVERLITWSSSRALTIYLWHGLGLLVSDRTVHTWWEGPTASLAGLVVVVVVTLAAAVLAGGLEDRAAGRGTSPVPRMARAAVLPGVVVVAVGLLASDVAPDAARVVPSGQAVMARADAAEVTEGRLDDLPGRGSAANSLEQATLEVVFDEWLGANAELLDHLGTNLIEVALVNGSGDSVVLQWTRDGHDGGLEPFPWWSMSKTMTTAWMMRLADQGVISLDAPLDDYLAGIPHGDEFTLSQLAGHRAGLPSELDADILTASPIDEVGAYLENPDLAYPPGEGYDYSRIGYHLLTWGLEEASGRSWRSAMESIAAEAGVQVSIDEDYILGDRITHPGGGDYRGALWGAGGLHGTTLDGARLFRWTLMEGLDEDAVRAMAAADAGHDYYGLGLTPMCPCVREGDRLSSDRVGLSTITGTYVVDLAADVGLMLRTDNWWSAEFGPALEFDDLILGLLDAASF